MHLSLSVCYCVRTQDFSSFSTRGILRWQSCALFQFRVCSTPAAMKPRVDVARCKTEDSEDLEKLLPLGCDTSPAYVSYTTVPPSGCSIAFLRCLSVILFLLLIGVVTGWFIHCAIFMNSYKKHTVIDTTLFFNNSNANLSDTILKLEDTLNPIVLKKVWNNGSLDVDLVRELVSKITGKEIKEIVIPPNVMEGCMKHLSEIMNHDFSFIFTDRNFMQAIIEMITQAPMPSVINPNELIASMMNNNVTKQAGELLNRFSNITKILNDTATNILTEKGITLETLRTENSLINYTHNHKIKKRHNR